ncbi:hypothetical protein IMSAG192_00317 [Muribaculaceae bacterium]|nr:hypothetical protein IMSAG192_00317 [Muribaculaceae bacterium]
MITKDAQGMACKCTGRNMEHAREQLAGNLVHVGNHQQQALRSGIGGSKRTGLKRTVHGTCRTGLRLHLLYKNSFTEDVFTTGRSPLVDIFCHCR